MAASAPLLPDADATRSAHFNTLLRDGTGVKLGLASAGASVLIALVQRDPGFLKFAVVAAPLAVLLMLLAMADRRAATDFFTRYAAARGLTHSVRGDLLPVTPLLSAGVRRSAEHLLEGPLPGSERRALMALYTYETPQLVSDGDGNQRDDYEPHHFTACLVDVPEAFPRFKGVYLHPRSGPFAHDWLTGRGHPEVELESVEFAAAYRLRVSEGQDRGPLRELFSPAMLVRLLDDSLRPGLELGAGGLCVFVAGKLEDVARLDRLRASAAALLGQVERELAERTLIGG